MPACAAPFVLQDIHPVSSARLYATLKFHLIGGLRPWPAGLRICSSELAYRRPTKNTPLKLDKIGFYFPDKTKPTQGGFCQCLLPEISFSPQPGFYRS